MVTVNETSAQLGITPRLAAITTEADTNNLSRQIDRNRSLVLPGHTQQRSTPASKAPAQRLSPRTPRPVTEDAEALRLFSCAICMGVLHEPLTAGCGAHNFCMSCLEEWLADHSTCPVCRVPVSARGGLHVNVGIAAAIAAIVAAQERKAGAGAATYNDLASVGVAAAIAAVVAVQKRKADATTAVSGAAFMGSRSGARATPISAAARASAAAPSPFYAAPPGVLRLTPQPPRGVVRRSIGDTSSSDSSDSSDSDSGP